MSFRTSLLSRRRIRASSSISFRTRWIMHCKAVTMRRLNMWMQQISWSWILKTGSSTSSSSIALAYLKQQTKERQICKKMVLSKPLRSLNIFSNNNLRRRWSYLLLKLLKQELVVTWVQSSRAQVFLMRLHLCTMQQTKNQSWRTEKWHQMSKWNTARMNRMKIN